MLPLLDGVSAKAVAHDDGVLTGHRFVVARGDHQHAHEHHAHVSWKHIHDMLETAPLDEATRGHAISIFTHLAEAEARVHGTTPDAVEFHEVGAWDSIADIVAAAFLIGQIGAARWSIGPLPLGGGRVKSAHGMLPVPAPATALLIEGFATIDDGISGERVTPTGAAIVRHLCAAEEPVRTARRLVGSAHGFGTRKLPGISNCLRVLAFETGAAAGLARDSIVVLECEIDDQTAEDLAVAIDHLRQRDGVLDIIQAPVFGKKGRVMTQLRVLVAETHEDGVVAAIFDETTTLGLRRQLVERHVLDREMSSAELDGHGLRVKLATRPSGRTAKVETGRSCRHRRGRGTQERTPARRSAVRRRGQQLMHDELAAVRRSTGAGGDRRQRRRRFDDARRFRSPSARRQRRNDACGITCGTVRGDGARAPIRRRGRLASVCARCRRIRRRRLHRQPAQPLLFLQDEPLRCHREPYRTPHAVGHQYRRSRRLPPGARGGARTPRASSLCRGRYRQARRAGTVPSARARRSCRTAVFAPACRAGSRRPFPSMPTC